MHGQGFGRPRDAAGIGEKRRINSVRLKVVVYQQRLRHSRPSHWLRGLGNYTPRVRLLPGGNEHVTPRASTPPYYRGDLHNAPKNGKRNLFIGLSPSTPPANNRIDGRRNIKPTNTLHNAWNAWFLHGSRRTLEGLKRLCRRGGRQERLVPDEPLRG